MKSNNLKKIKNASELTSILKDMGAVPNSDPYEIWVSEFHRDDSAFRDFLVTMTWKDGSQKSFHVEDRFGAEKKRFTQYANLKSISEIFDEN